MKKILFVLAIVVLLTSCGAKEEGSMIRNEEIAIEKPIAIVVRHHVVGSPLIEYEDTFFKYRVDLNYIANDSNRNTNEIFPTCPVGSATYTVLEKSTGQFVTDEEISQRPCNRCHPRS